MPTTKPKTEKHAGGRPTRCTPEFTAKFVKYMRAGNYLCTVCDALGVGEGRVYEWFQKGEAGEEPYAEFRELVKRAAAEAEVETVALIRLHGQGDREGNWQALMTFLERRYPERWGRRVSEVKQRVDLKAEVQVEQTGGMDEQLARAGRILALVAQCVGGAGGEPGPPGADAEPGPE